MKRIALLLIAIASLPGSIAYGANSALIAAEKREKAAEARATQAEQKLKAAETRATQAEQKEKAAEARAKAAEQKEKTAEVKAKQTSNPKEPTFSGFLSLLKTKQFVDLTHAFEPGIPHWPGFPDEKVETLGSNNASESSGENEFFVQRFSLVGQWGTHCDAPVHGANDKRTIDQIDLQEMILPLVVLDVHAQAEKNADYTISMEDVQAWEKQHGKIPTGAFVAMRTDWSKRWPDAKKMRNEDAKGVAHYPGWSMDVLKYLYEERKITASGHETMDTDPGIATSKKDYSLEKYVLGTNHYQIELLDSLDRVPESGAIVVVTFPKPKGGSGFPARVFAIVP